MRVVHVYKDIYPVLGGMENHVRELCRELAARSDLDVRILVTSPDRHSSVSTLDGVPVTRVGRFATVASTPLSVRLAFELARLKPDLIHLHFPYPVGELSAMLATPGVPTVITYQSDVVRQKMLLRFYSPLLKRVLARASRILVTSEQYLASSPWLQPFKQKCRVVPLGIDLSPFLGGGRQSDGRTLLFVGRFRYYKGLRYLIEALPMIDGARLVLVGSGAGEEALRAQVARLGLQSRVTFAGNVAESDLPAVYQQADVFVLPASERSEAFGLVLVEASAAALPCVSTELGTGTSYVNLHDETGLVVPPADPRALAAACNRLLADPALRRRMGTAARQRAIALFDIRRVADAVAAIYHDVAGDATER